MRNVVFGAAVMALCSIVRDAPATQLEVPVAEVELRACARLEGAQLGALPLEVKVGGKTVRFAEWTVADERSTSLVGFAAHLPSDVTFTVEAGEQTFLGDAPRWLHPLGVSGPRVHGIDAITFCTRARPPTLAQR